MTYKFHSNGVITGCLNSFCLACDLYLDAQEAAADHIGTSEHKKRLHAVQYSDKFQYEHIRKFKGGYYCEFCNVLMPIASKVNIHITEDEHKHNKGILLLKPMGGDVIAFNNIVIDAEAWHGLIEGVCSLCNAEFDDEKEHKADAKHSLNLVLKPIQFGADNAIFRHLDDTAVQCLTCNKLLAPGRMTKHFDETEHQELYAKRRIETNGVHYGIEIEENCQGIEAKGTSQGIEAKGTSQGIEAKGTSQGIEAKGTSQGSEADENNKEKPTNMSSATENDGEPKKSKINDDNNNNTDVKSPTKDKSKILEFIAKYQSKGININLETETAFCKKCSKVVTFDHIEIENHIKNHSSTEAVDSDLLYPSALDQNLNRVDINDKTTKSSGEIENDTVKALRDKAQNLDSHEEIYVEEDTDTDSTCSLSDFIPVPINSEKCSQEEDAMSFAKANKITFNEGNNQSFCHVCKVQVPASFRSLKEHVEGANHKRQAGSSVNKPKPSKTPSNLVKESTKPPKTPRNLAKESTREFVDSAYDIQGILYTASIINDEFCIPKKSFHFISESGFRRRCIVCEVNLTPFVEIDEHCKLRQHVTKWLEVPVITSEKNEIIREVRPGLFHCGYCNLVVSGWSDMKQHLECSDHRENRSAWESRLRFHLPSLRRYRLEREMEQFTMMRLFAMLNH